MPTWMRWIGLPHGFGAHPEDGIACDCLLMVWSVLDEAGVHHPPFVQEWLDLAREGHWRDLQKLWDAGTRILQEPQPYAVTLFHNGPNGLGVGVVVDDGLLMVHHKRGVCWIPLAVMKRLPYYEFV
jgi:hypothetical protein